MSLDASLLSTMSPEEREAIEGADPAEIESLKNVSGAEKDDIASKAGADDLDDDEDGDEHDDEAPAAAAPPVEGEGAAPAAPASDKDEDAPAAVADAAPAEPAAPAATAPTPAVNPVPFTYRLPEDFEQRQAAAREAIDTLLERFEAGELTREEFKAEQSKLDEERRQLDNMRNKAEIAAEMQQQAAEARRQAAIDALFTEAAKPEAGAIDYRKDQAKMRDLDVFVRALAADDANADKSLDWFLREGHRRVMMLHNVSATTPTPTPTPAPAAAATKGDAKKAAGDARKPPLDAVPPSLADIPGGQGAGDVGGEFADILALDGDAFEEAIARMAKTDPQRWSRFQAGNQ